MLIVSNYHDYYDTALTYGVDKSIVYKRTRSEKPERVRLSDVVGDTQSRFFCSLQGHRRQHFLLIAGKLYPFFRYPTDWKDVRGRYQGFDWQYLHYNDLQNDLHKLIHWWDNCGPFIWPKKNERNLSDKEIIRRAIMSVFAYQGKTVFDFCLDNNIVTAHLWFDEEVKQKGMWGRPVDKFMKMERNPCLKELDFMRQLDPYTCFQEIMMWISGVAGSPAGEMVEISDKDMVVSKGFDETYGFRTRPKK